MYINFQHCIPLYKWYKFDLFVFQLVFIWHIFSWRFNEKLTFHKKLFFSNETSQVWLKSYTFLACLVNVSLYLLNFKSMSITPSFYLLVQSQHQQHQNGVLNPLKVNNKETRKTSWLRSRLSNPWKNRSVIEVLSTEQVLSTLLTSQKTIKGSLVIISALKRTSQKASTCSKLTMQALEKGVKFFQS